jgi:glyoxylase-like metal-dependent hydrolase (beta-lactamase superfamily II)
LQNSEGDDGVFELIQVGERSYYINCPAKIGVYRLSDGDVCLIDSGNDKDAGRKVRKIMEENGWRLRAIVNTHSNADHIGGNRYLQQQTGCRVFANGIEAAFTRYPILEPSFLYGGYPCRDLRHKFLLAAESEAADIGGEGFPQELEVIPLPGHFFAMVGIRTPDDVVFLADCISDRSALEKYRIAFLYDVEAYLATLDRVAAMEAAMFVPAHAEAAKDVKELAGFNRDKVHEVADRLTALCETPLNFEAILQRVFEGYGLTMNFEQYVLVGSTVRSYLSWLKDRGRVEARFEDNMLLWRRL